MKLEYNITIEQTQKLAMTTELIQAIQILQFNAQELDAYVTEQLLANPVLEVNETEKVSKADASEAATDSDSRADSDALEEYLREREYDDISYHQRDYVNREESDNYERYVTAEVTLPEHLMFQLQFSVKDPEDRRIGKYIIESLDANGYMTSSVEELAEALEADTDRIQQLLTTVRTFDPTGVGAENLEQCLLIQLDALGLKDEAMETLLTEHMKDLASNRLSVIAKDMKRNVSDVQKMVDLIKTLNPRPGREFLQDNDKTEYIVPDLLLEEVDGEFIVSLNDKTVPSLKVSSYYRKVLSQSKDDEAVTKYLNERLNAATWVIRSIEQRKQTILNVAQAIVASQRDFFEKGKKYLKTMTLHDIAETVGIHESTVSRTVNGKYIQCSKGVFELKYFFSAGVRGSGGEEVSSKSIKSYISEFIGEEDSSSPLSDQKLAEMLHAQGFSVSRRTVAKYRDELNIPSSSKRKRY